MKNKHFFFSFTLLICICTNCLRAQIITTFAGNGSGVSSGNGGPATAAGFAVRLDGITLDKFGNIYVNDSNFIRKINPSGIITAYAGTGISSFNGDSIPATAANFQPDDFYTDLNGNLLLGDNYNSRVRKIDSAGLIYTIAGTGVRGYTGDGGPASAAELGFSWSSIDNKGNIYLAGSVSGGNVFRKINTAGIITTIAGNGSTGFSGDGGPATAASFGLALGPPVADYAGNVYVCDYYNFRIRKIDTFGIITTFAGNGTCNDAAIDSADGVPATDAQVCQPQGLAVDSFGNVYYTEFIHNEVRKIDTLGIIHTIADTLGICGYTGDGGLAAAAEVCSPRTMTINPSGLKIYFADVGNYVIRLITDTLPAPPDTTNGVKSPLLAVAGMAIAPNPAAAGRFSVTLTSAYNEEAIVTVTNVLGIKIKRQTATTNIPTALQLNSPPGVYMVTVVTAHGVWSGKLIIDN